MKFDLPAKLNGATLRKELAQIGVILPENRNAILVSENDLFLNIDEKDYSKVVNALQNHNGDDSISENKEKREALLAKLGITEEEAKLLLS